MNPYFDQEEQGCSSEDCVTAGVLVQIKSGVSDTLAAEQKQSGLEA